MQYVRKTFQCRPQTSIYWGRREFSLPHTIQQCSIFIWELLHLRAYKLHLLQALKLVNRCYQYEFCEVSSLLGCYLAPQVCKSSPFITSYLLDFIWRCHDVWIMQRWVTCGAILLSWPCRAVQLLSVRPHAGYYHCQQILLSCNGRITAALT